MRLETIVALFCILSAGGTHADVTQIDNKTEKRLHAVVDGDDTRDEGFAALVNHVKSWEGKNQHFTTPLSKELLQIPQRYRGEIFTLSGILELATPLETPWEGIDELFVRNQDGDLYCLYVVGSVNIALKQTLETPALFYKTMEMEGRDRQKRVYPTFVTSSMVMTTSVNNLNLPFELFAVPIFCIVILLFYKLKSNKKVHRHPTIRTQEVLDAASETSESLPNDPSEALASMYNQSEHEE